MTDEKDETPTSPEIHFEPVIRLPEVNVKTLEEDEEELLKLRARLYRYASNEVPPEWKERGTGDVKLLRHNEKGTVRLLMRRDKTLKVCANHYITPWMELKPNCGSDRAWVWSVSADFADEEPKEEMLAIKFANAEHAKKFKEVFDQCKRNISDSSTKEDEEETGSNELSNKLEKLTVKQTESQTESAGDVKTESSSAKGNEADSKENVKSSTLTEEADKK